MLSQKIITSYAISGILISFMQSCSPGEIPPDKNLEPYVDNQVEHYVNPLPLEKMPVPDGSKWEGAWDYDLINVADPVVVLFEEEYYLFCTGGKAWVSSDLVNWKYHEVSLPEGRHAGAPHVAEYRGFLSMCGNSTDLFRAPHPLGPWEFIGEFRDESGEVFDLFDAMMYVDDDDRVYMYYSGGSTNGIYGVELDQDNLTQFKSKPTHFFSFEPSHIWERYGDLNEYSRLSWIEAPWMTKHNGTYYLQYSAPGTEWKTYAVGYYTGDSPLGPFTYYEGSPIFVHNQGLINSVGHHCLIEAPDGSLWAFFNILLHVWTAEDLERRIGMDRAEFDKNGNLKIYGPTETPQPGPAVHRKSEPAEKENIMPVTINKPFYSYSSAAPGRDAQYAFDNYVRTWWEADKEDPQPTLTLNLSYEDAPQYYTISSSRIIFAANRLKRSAGIDMGPFQYKIEVSQDGENFKIIVDKSGNNIEKTIEYDEFEPVQCRHVRLSITGSPAKVPVGIIEFTVFGTPVEP